MVLHAIPSEIDRLARIIWDYHLMNQPLLPAECIFVLGSHDVRVADRAVDLFQEGYAPYLIFSGGFGNFTAGTFPKPEAELFADIALQRGVPPDNILIENKSTNTGENVQFTKELLAAKGFNFQSFILVQKPNMERRTYATFQKNWPGKDFVVTSPQISYDDYPNHEIPREKVINIMVGDLQRIREYPARGFQIPQEIPDAVWNAFEKLVAAGYVSHLIRQ
jgi:uncharacterized SAM-binding protein YcdF (DUF218 family)